MRRAPRPFARACALASLVWLAIACSGGGGGDQTIENPPGGPPPGTRESRAIAGVSMGGYGALNLGTKHADLFIAIGSLGGPVDLSVLLDDIARQNLEVKPLAGIPSGPDADTTFDLLPAYP